MFARARPVRRSVAALLAILAGAVSLRAEPELPPRFEDVMQELAGSRGWRADFVERRRIPLLAEPVESRGRLAVVPPSAFARVVEAPRRSRLVLEAGDLRVEPDEGAAASAAALRRVADEFLVLLGGDLDTLRERYELAFDAPGPGWSLTMTPRAREARRHVTWLVLRGDASGLVSLELEEPGGGSAITRFSRVVADRPLDAEERAFFFGPRSDP